MSTYALWKKYKNDDDFLNEHLLHIMTGITEECEKDDLDYKKLKNYFEELKFYLEKAPDKVIKEITEYNMELLSFINALIWLFQSSEYVDEIYEITKKIAKRTNNELFELFDVFKKIENGGEWKNHYHKIVSKNKYCILPHIFIFDFLDYEGKYDKTEEEILVNALNVVKLREEDKQWDVDCYTGNAVYDDYTTVIDFLENLYIETNQKQKEKELGEFRKEINFREKELSYSPRSEKMEKKLENMRSETDDMQRVDKLLDDSPMKKYYDFLKKTKINFATEKKTEDIINIVNRERVGRNEPCPCGSGKKYKKCCL